MAAGGITIDGEFAVPMFSPTCTLCQNLTDAANRQCVAFPGRIPFSIWVGQNEHRHPYPGDHGIRFEPIEAGK